MTRGLRVALTVLGIVAVVAGALAVATGPALVSGGDDVSASVDSEFRFYAAWYVFAGVVLVHAARRVETAGFTVRLVSAALFLAACARVVSIIVIGAPKPTFLVLMAIEFAIPVVILPWQATVERRASQARVPSSV